MQEFSARIYKVGINLAVDVPQHVARAFHKSGYIPIKGKINAQVAFNSTLCPTGGGNYRLYINALIRQQTGASVGQRILIQIAQDSNRQEPPIPNALNQALANNLRAQVRFDNLLPGRRKEVLEYLNSLKSKTALERNIKKFIDKLNASKIKVDGPK